MLGMTREEIVEYAREHGVEYREDRTNAENDARRNRIRNNVFPEFAQINPSFVRTLNADMERFAQADDIAEDYFREAEAGVVDGNAVRVPELLALKHWKYVFFRLMEPYGFHAETFGAMVRLLEERAEGGGGTFAGKRFLSGTHVVETSSDAMTVMPRGGEGAEARGVPVRSLTVSGPGDYRLLGRTVRVESAPCGALKQPAGVLVCDADALPFPFTLRAWRPGDWMKPFGMGGRSKKLSDLFTDAKMSRTDKETAVVVAPDSWEEGHVAAVAGLRMDEALRVAKGSEKVLRITLL